MFLLRRQNLLHASRQDRVALVPPLRPAICARPGSDGICPGVGVPVALAASAAGGGSSGEGNDSRNGTPPGTDFGAGPVV